MTKTPTYYCVGFLFIIGFLGSGERMNFFRIPPRIEVFLTTTKFENFPPPPLQKRIKRIFIIMINIFIPTYVPNF